MSEEVVRRDGGKLTAAVKNRVARLAGLRLQVGEEMETFWEEVEEQLG